MMLLVPVSPKIRRFLDGMSLSVIAAIVASALAVGTMREAVATAIAGLVMLGSKSAIGAMSAGIVLAAIWTLIGG